MIVLHLLRNNTSTCRAIESTGGSANLNAASHTLCMALLFSLVALWNRATLAVPVSNILRGTSDLDEWVRLSPCLLKRFSDDF